MTRLKVWIKKTKRTSLVREAGPHPLVTNSMAHKLMACAREIQMKKIKRFSPPYLRFKRVNSRLKLEKKARVTFPMGGR